MASTTPRVGMYMPADDGSEPMNVATDLNDNLEKLDNAVGFVQSTSAVNPTVMYEGVASYETDTGRAKFRVGSAWNYLLNAGATFLNNILLGTANRIGIGITSPAAIFDVVVATITSVPLLKFKQASHATHSLEINHDGIRIGGGTTAPETRIYRATSNQLAVTGNLSLQNQLSVTGSSSFSNVQVTGNLDVDGTFTGDLNLAGNLNVGGIGKRQVAYKTSDLSRSGTTTPTFDPQLIIPVVPNGVYEVELVGHADGSSGGDIRINWWAPPGSVGQRMISGPALTMTSRDSTATRVGSYAFNTDVGYGTDTTVGAISFHEKGIIIVGADSGNITINWAQISATGTTTLKQYTMLIVTRIA